MPLINCRVELSLRCIWNCETFKITDAKLYVPVFTLSTMQD